MKNALVYLILCLMMAPTILVSQDYSIKNFNRENGLPNNLIYSIAQDKTGLLWVATETGLCTFNGSTFNLNPIPELTNEEIINLYLDKKNRLWFAGINGSIYILQDGKLSVFQNENIQEELISIAEDPLGNIWIRGIRDNTRDIAFDTDDFSLKYYLNTDEKKLQALKEILGELPGFQDRMFMENGQFIYENSGIITKFEENSVFQFFKELRILNKDNWIFKGHNRLYHYNVQTGILNPLLTKYNEEFDKGLGGITVDKFNNLWIEKKFGLMMVKNVLSPEPDIRYFLEDTNVGECHTDLDGNIWVSTQPNGLFMISPAKVQTIETSKIECATSIYKNKDFLVYGTLNGEVVILDKDFEEVKRIQLNDKQSKIYKIEEYKENIILVVSTRVIELIDLTDFTISNLQKEGFFKNATLDEFGTIWISGGWHNYIYNDKTKDLTTSSLNKRSYSCLPLSEDAALFGTVKGLYKVNKSNDVQKMLGPDFNKDIRHISHGPDNSILLSTQADGIFVMKNDSIVYHYKALPSLNIRKAIYVDNTLWLASNDGLSQVMSEKLKFHYKTIGQTDGLPSSSILDFYSFEDKIYCATEAGIAIVDIDVKFDEEMPILQIDNVKINARDTTLLDNYDLNQEQNNIHISYNSIYFKNPESVKYKYKLSGLNIDWTETDQTVVQYPSLPAGEYEFQIQTKSLNSKWGAMQSIYFNIPFRFAETILYKLLMALLIGGLAVFFFSLTLKNRERKRALKISQLMALRNQMNPHFIFNSLNSVQDYILSDDKRAANKYISQFSKLMRYILNTSDHEFTDLNLELDALKLYLSIESMRFDNTLIYNINIGPGVDPKKYQIPTMIIQPFVENAIKHGLIHAKGEKSLNINVNKMEKGLYFEVIDNGVGRVHSQKLNSKNLEKYDPKGTGLIQKRIELLNKGYKSDNKVTFEDIYDLAGNPTGTKVKIVLQSIKFKP